RNLATQATIGDTGLVRQLGIRLPLRVMNDAYAKAHIDEMPDAKMKDALQKICVGHRHAISDAIKAGFDLRLMYWGDGSRVPTSGKNLVVVGNDNDGLLHIRIFDVDGRCVTDTDEKQLPTQATAIATLKQQISALLPPRVLTDAAKEQVIKEV